MSSPIPDGVMVSAENIGRIYAEARECLARMTRAEIALRFAVARAAPCHDDAPVRDWDLVAFMDHAFLLADAFIAARDGTK